MEWKGVVDPSRWRRALAIRVLQRKGRQHELLLDVHLCLVGGVELEDGSGRVLCFGYLVGRVTG